MALESKEIEIGVPCPQFELIGTDGKTYSLNTWKEHQVLVIGFICNHCPYVKAYEDRLNALIGRYSDKNFSSTDVAFVCISSNDSVAYPEDSFEKMKERAETEALKYVYLFDESQEVAKRFNAACTPEFYVYDSDRKLAYHGKLDDNHQDPAAVKESYLKNAIDDLLAGKWPRKPQTHAIGCSIKWKKSS